MWILLYKLFIEFLDPAYNKHPIIFPRAALMNEFCVVSKTVFLKMYAWCLLALHVILNKSSTGGSSCGKKRSCGVVLEKGLMQHLVLKALMMTGYMACQVVVYPLRLTLLTDCYVPKLFCLNLTRHAEWKIIIIIMTLELYSTFFPLKSPSVWPAIPFLIWLFNTFPSVLLRLHPFLFYNRNFVLVQNICYHWVLQKREKSLSCILGLEENNCFL